MIEENLTRGAIASRILLDKPKKIRFVRSPALSDVDIEKLQTLCSFNSYTLEVSDKFLTFLFVENET